MLHVGRKSIAELPGITIGYPNSKNKKQLWLLLKVVGAKLFNQLLEDIKEVQTEK